MINIKDILYLIKTGNNDQLDKIICETPSISDKKTEQGISLLLFAAYCRNKQAVDIIKKQKQELDIFEATSIGDLDLVKNQIDKNSGLTNSYSPDGFTPLGLASFFGHYDIVKFILEKGANPNLAANNEFKVAPIHSACAISNYDIADILIKHGADVNAKQMQGVTPLHSAAHNGPTKLAKLLIDSGADVNMQTDNGQTALFMAEEKNFREIAELIKLHDRQ